MVFYLCTYLALNEYTTSTIIPITPSLQESSTGLMVTSPSLTNTQQVISTSSSMVVSQSHTNNYVATSTTSPLMMFSQSITTAGMYTVYVHLVLKILFATTYSINLCTLVFYS